MNTKQTGDLGEGIAAQYLENLGYVILARQYRFERAEVDLVCFEPAPNNEPSGEIVFVEVKTRRGLGFGRPEDAVTDAKKRNILRAAEAYLYETKLEGAMCRFDVIAILLKKEKKPEIEHFKDAFFAFGF